LNDIPDIVVEPGEVGLVTSIMGDELPAGQFLVDGDLGQTRYKGVLRKVFPPGRYRINNYAYKFEKVKLVTTNSGGGQKYGGWINVPTGYVGVVTNLAVNEAAGIKPGIQEKVLQPGLYLVNPREQQVDIIEVGY